MGVIVLRPRHGGIYLEAVGRTTGFAFRPPGGHSKPRGVAKAPPLGTFPGPEAQAQGYHGRADS